MASDKHSQPDSAPDEFYIGYHPTAPAGMTRQVRLFVGAYLVLSMIIATACVAFIARTGTGVWEDGSFKQYTGVLISTPYPIVELDKPPVPGTGRTALLVDFGKRGAQERLKSVSSGRVRITGTTIHREGRVLIELAPEPDSIVNITDQAGALSAPVQGPFGRKSVTLRGEIVDPKCFMGAMKPGEGKTHKGCAIRCIAGGIPPMLVCWDRHGHSTSYVLVGSKGEPVNEHVLGFVGEPVEVTGELQRIGDLMMIRLHYEGVRPL